MGACRKEFQSFFGLKLCLKTGHSVSLWSLALFEKVSDLKCIDSVLVPVSKTETGRKFFFRFQSMENLDKMRLTALYEKNLSAETKQHIYFVFVFYQFLSCI
jgi:hypothetical protein